MTRLTFATFFIRSIGDRGIHFAIPHVRTWKIRPSCFACCIRKKNVAVKLTTGFLLDPEQSTSAIVAHHPAAKYFVI